MITPFVGDVVTSRTGAAYTVASVDPKGFDLLRVSGKTVRVTFSKVAKAWTDLQAGPLAFQQNPSKGGISGTVAIEAGVIWCLGDAVKPAAATREWVKA